MDEERAWKERVTKFVLEVADYLERNSIYGFVCLRPAKAKTYVEILVNSASLDDIKDIERIAKRTLEDNIDVWVDAEDNLVHIRIMPVAEDW